MKYFCVIVLLFIAILDQEAECSKKRSKPHGSVCEQKFLKCLNKGKSGKSPEMCNAENEKRHHCSPINNYEKVKGKKGENKWRINRDRNLAIAGVRQVNPDATTLKPPPREFVKADLSDMLKDGVNLDRVTTIVKA